MDAKTTNGSTELGWASVSACTLPTAQRPLRLREFDALFRSRLRSIERPTDTHAQLLLAGDTDLAAHTQRLAAAESSCCSFFTFGVTTPEPGLVVLDVEVPQAYTDVLSGLVARAQAARDGAG